MALQLSGIIERYGLTPHPALFQDMEITGVRPLDRAGSGDLTFLNNKKYREQVRTTQATAVLIAEPVPSCAAVQLVCANPYAVLARILADLYPEPTYPEGVHASAVVAPDACLGKGCVIGPHCVVESGAHIDDGTVLVAQNFVGAQARIGKNCRLFPGVVVYRDCRIGDRVRLHANVVVGSDGYGYAQDGGVHVKVPQIGSVIIEDDVEIGANTTIDRGSLSDTFIGAGTKIDNLVQIAHNVEIGKGALIVSQTGIAGSSKIGNYAVLAGQVGVNGHVHIGDQVLVMGKSVVTKDLSGPGKYAGNPAIPAMQYQRQLASLRRLDKMARKPGNDKSK